MLLLLFLTQCYYKNNDHDKISFEAFGGKGCSYLLFIYLFI